MANQEKSCVACTYLKQKCGDDCIFAPLFPQNDSKNSEKLASVDGSDNVSKMLITIPESNRTEDAAVESLHEEEKTSSVARWQCPACMFLWHKCESDCLFAPTFPQNNPNKFNNMVARYGADVVKELLMSVLESHHKVPVKSLHQDHLSSHTLMPFSSHLIIGVSDDVASVEGSSQQRAKDKGKGKLMPENTGQMLITQPQPDGYLRIADQMSWADMRQLLSGEPQQPELNTVFGMPPTSRSSETVQYSLLQSQQQQLQQNQQPYLPPDYQDSELSLRLPLLGQQNQQLQSHSDIRSCDPPLRSQMVVQPQQHHQSQSQVQSSQPALDQQPRSPSDEGKSSG